MNNLGSGRIPKQAIEVISKAEYWKRHAEHEPLPSMKEPCFDCAMTCGFYKPYADELLEQTAEIIENVLKTWYCHNHGNRACKGTEDYVRENLLNKPFARQQYPAKR